MQKSLVKQKDKAVDIAVSDSTRRPLIGIVGHMIGPNSFGVTFPYLRYYCHYFYCLTIGKSIQTQSILPYF